MSKKQLKTYNPQRSNSSSNGWVNYSGARASEFEAARSRVFEDHPGSVIVDGTDDWFSPIAYRPETFCGRLGVEPLAYYHSGISGMSKSGVVLSSDDYERLERLYEETYDSPLETNLRVYREEEK